MSLDNYKVNYHMQKYNTFIKEKCLGFYHEESKIPVVHPHPQKSVCLL